MKLFPTYAPFLQIDESRYIGFAIFGFVIIGLSFGDTDHYGIVLLGLFVGLVYWTDSQWQQFLIDDREI